MELAQIRTGDGRALEYAITGPADGPVLLFHHGTPGSVHQDRFLARAVHARDWRLLSYSRAGYGGSSRSRGRSVADVVPDSAALLDAVGAERAVVAGASGGGPHALACAAGLPGRVAAALCIAGVGPSGAQGLEFLAGMGQDNVDEFGAGAQGEDALRGYLEPQADQLRNATPTEIVTSLASI